MTGIQEVALAEAEGSGRWSSEVTTAGWWGSCQEGTVGLAGLQLQQYETKSGSSFITLTLAWYYTHSFRRSLFVPGLHYSRYPVLFSVPTHPHLTITWNVFFIAINL